MTYENYIKGLKGQIEDLRNCAKSAKEGLCSNEEIQENIKKGNDLIDLIDDLKSDLETNYRRFDSSNKNPLELIEQYGEPEEIQESIAKLQSEKSAVLHIVDICGGLLVGKHNFDKSLCFSNIRYLLKQNSEVKIGQIEKEAGIRPGYLSRLEKEGNTSEPSVEFIVTAAKLLKVSVDSIINVDLAGLTPTEQYLSKFFDKLMNDTLKDKLEWNRETAFSLNRIEPDINGLIEHPLFSEESFYEETGSDYPEMVDRIVFNSKTFGPNTYIAGDCFNLRLKNGTTLYLMDIEKSSHKVSDQLAFAKEAWMFVPTKGKQSLVASQDETPVAPMLEKLFSTVKERMEHPKVDKYAMYAIDAFMKDDINDDEAGPQSFADEDIPF